MSTTTMRHRIATGILAAAFVLGLAGAACDLPVAGTALADEDEPFTMEADCASCHKKAVKKMNKEGYTGAKHAALDCGFCHNEDDLVKIHTETEKYNAKKGDKVVALTKSNINEAACFACHLPTLETVDKDGNDLAPEELSAAGMSMLAEQTADSQILTDKDGTTVNPHALPEGHYGEKIMCGSCHKFHDTKTIEESANNACLSCHHDNVYECGTCHAV